MIIYHFTQLFINNMDPPTTDVFVAYFNENIEIFQNATSHVCDHIVNNRMDQIEQVISRYLNYYNLNDVDVNKFVANYLNCAILTIYNSNSKNVLLNECNLYLETKNEKRFIGFIFSLLKPKV